MVQIVRKERVFQNSGAMRPLVVLRRWLMARREEISAPFTRSPRFCGVQFSKGGGKERVLLHQIKEAREPLKVVGARHGSLCATMVVVVVVAARD